MNRPTKKQYRELKDFKLRVGLEAYNAIQLYSNNDEKYLTNILEQEGLILYKGYEVKIGNAVFIFYPQRYHRKLVDEILKKFTTTRW